MVAVAVAAAVAVVVAVVVGVAMVVTAGKGGESFFCTAHRSDVPQHPPPLAGVGARGWITHSRTDYKHARIWQQLGGGLMPLMPPKPTNVLSMNKHK